MGAELMYFEIPGDDLDALTEFYTRVMRWTIGPRAEQREDYRTIETSTDKNAVGGGLFKKATPDQAIINYFKVDNVAGAIELVESNGGKVVEKRSAIPGMGFFALCADPEGHIFGLWQGDTDAE
jgi:uncharacterized protein